MRSRCTFLQLLVCLYLACWASGQVPAPPFAGIWGEFLIAAFVPMHRPAGSFGCSKDLRSNETIELTESFLYAVDIFNNNSGPWQEKPSLAGKLGIIVFDTCQNPLRASWLLSTWLLGQMHMEDAHGHVYSPQQVVGIVGPLYSSEAEEVAKIAEKENLVQISYSATSVALFNYATFLRTIPADDVQAQVMVDFAREIKADAISILYRDDSYGTKGYEEVVRRSKAAKICIDVAIEVPFNVTELENRMSEILNRLTDTKDDTKVVILFVGWEQAMAILKGARKTFTDRRRFLWIGTESWGSREIMLELTPTVCGAFSIDVAKEESKYTNGIVEYITTLKPGSNDRNMFFNESFEVYLQCQLSNSSKVKGRPCTDDDVLQTAKDPKADLNLRSVWALALGVSSVVKEICHGIRNCPELRTKENVMKILQATKGTKVTNPDGTLKRIFKERGDGNVAEDILNVQIDDNKKPFYKMIATFTDMLTVIEEPLYYNLQYDRVDIPKSECKYCNCSYKNKSDPLLTLSNYVAIPGDLYLVSFVPVHSSEYSTEISPSGHTEALALQAAVAQLNAKNSSRFRLGLLVFDSYSNWDITLWHLVSLSGVGKYFDLNQYKVDLDQIAGLLLNSRGTGTEALTDIASRQQIIHLDIGTSSNHSQTSSFYFPLGWHLETELEILADTVKHLDWEYVLVVYSKSTQAEYAKSVVEERFHKYDVCAEYLQTSDETSSDVIATKIQTSKANVVFALVEEEEVEPLFNSLGLMKLKRQLQFIGWQPFILGIKKVKGSYQSVGNGTIGVADIQVYLDQLEEQVRDQMIKVENDPWLTWATNLKTNLNSTIEDHHNIIEKVVSSVQSLKNAAQEFLDHECQDHSKTLVTDCIRYVQENVGQWRLRFRDVYRKKYQEIQKAAENKVFLLQSFLIKDKSSYSPITIGEYSSGKLMSKKEMEFLYTGVQANCEDDMCHKCHEKDGGGGLQTSVIVLLVLFLVSVLANILLLGWLIRKKSQSSGSKSEDKDLYWMTANASVSYEDTHGQQDAMNIQFENDEGPPRSPPTNYAGHIPSSTEINHRDRNDDNPHDERLEPMYLTTSDHQ